MSKLSVFLRQRFGNDAVNHVSTAVDWFKQEYADHADDIIPLVQQTIAAVDGGSADGSFKKQIATTVLSGALKATGVNVPTWASDWLIQELLAVFRINDPANAKTPVITPQTPAPGSPAT